MNRVRAGKGEHQHPYSRPRPKSGEGASNPPPDSRAHAGSPGSQAATLLRTGVAAVRFLNSALQQQLSELRTKLEMVDSGMPTVPLDPNKVRATRWGKRHASAFSSATFRNFKALIAHKGGNVQPILVRVVPGFGYEVVFGHRRHRACLELGLPVLAVIWQGSMSDAELFAAMDAENRGREDPSTFEQGTMYATALESKLFPSQRRLAEAIGVSHTWVRKAIQVAKLPEAVLMAFDDPCQIQPAHAHQIALALDCDGGAVLQRALALASSGAGLKASDVVDRLLARSPGGSAATPLMYQQRLLGSWRRDAKGRAVLTLEAEFSTPDLMKKIETLLGQAGVTSSGNLVSGTTVTC